MIKDIKYNGYTSSPSDYECPDGDMGGMLNLVPEDGALRPIFPGTTKFTLSAGQRIACIHETSAFKHYIVIDASGSSVDKVLFLNDGDPDIYNTGVTLPKNIYKCSAIGNTLVLITDDGFHYVLWQPDTRAYMYLGQKPDELPISVSMSDIQKDSYDRSTIEATDTSKTYSSAWRDVSITANANCHLNSNKDALSFETDKQSTISTAIWALINQTNAKIRSSGHFYAPFFIRYAYRLYDGNTFMASAPIFMPLTMPKTFYVEVANAYSNNGVISINDRLSVKEEGDPSATDFIVNALTFRYTPINEYVNITMNAAIDNLRSKWSDIIKSVDFFVSLPLIRELDGENIRTASIAPDSEILAGPFLGKRPYSWKFGSDTSNLCNVVCDIPSLSDDAYMSKIKSVANFYKVCSIPLDSSILNYNMGSSQKLPIDGTTLNALAAQETLDDDYKSHNILLPVVGSSGCEAYCFNYNSRLNISGIKERLFHGFSITQMLPGHVGNLYVRRIDVSIKTDDGEKIVSYTEPYFNNCDVRALYNIPIYYPDRRATKMIIYATTHLFGNMDTIYKSYTLEMQPSDFLNGSFTKGGLFNGGTTASYNDSSVEQQISAFPEVVVDDVVTIQSKLYTSEVNNPFVFKTKGIVTVGTGRILGISTAAKALSQGQFGQFPLYAFTSDGVWALEVNTTTGGYLARQPITRDVCKNPASITQMDSAVLFATDRGIMLLSGSNSQCISDILNGDEAFNPLSLPAGEKIITEAGFITEQLNYKPFMEYLKGCGILYDYTHQRIIVYNPKCRYAYVYSMKDKQWGMIPSNIADGVNSYPDALAMTDDGSLINLSTDYTSDGELLKGIRGLVFTRPFKLDAPDLLKTIDTIIQRGKFQRGHVQQVLYGSRDLINWQLVWSSNDMYLRGFRGTPYKYFRLALLCQLDADESLYGFTVQYTPRDLNQPR